MKINSFTIENFRTFRDKTHLELSDINIFIGSNSAGKSNIIEFLKFIRDLSSGTWSRPFTELTFDRNNNPISFEIELELDDGEIESIVNHITTPKNIGNYKKDNLFKTIKYTAKVNSQRCLDEHLYVWAMDRYVRVIQYLFTPPHKIERLLLHIDRHYHSNNGDTSGFLSQGMSLRNESNEITVGIFSPQMSDVHTDFFIVGMMKKFFQNIRIFDAFRRANPEFKGSEKRILHETGENVNEVMSTMLGDDRNLFDDIMKNYDKILGTQFTVNVPLAPSNEYHIVTIKEKGLETQTDFRNMSTGLHQALILILAIKQSKKDEMICIEEPEINLHSSAQKRLFKLIFDHSKTNQFFITTHSPIFTRLGNEFKTYLVTRTNGISEIITIEKDDQLRFVRQQIL